MGLYALLPLLVAGASATTVNPPSCTGVRLDFMSPTEVRVVHDNVKFGKSAVCVPKARSRQQVTVNGKTKQTWASWFQVQDAPGYGEFQGLDLSWDHQFKIDRCCKATSFVDLKASDFVAADGTQCVVGEEFVESGVCKTLTTCGADEWTSQTPTATADRVCTALTVCNTALDVETREAGLYHDRECRRKQQYVINPPGAAQGDFATVEECLKAALPGDSCLLSAGDYPESISLDSTYLQGSDAHPITLGLAPGAAKSSVRFVGTEEFNGLTWTLHEGSVWKTTIPADRTIPWQLWQVDGTQDANEQRAMLQTARWPNAAFDRDFIYGTDETEGVFEMAGTVWDHHDFSKFSPNSLNPKGSLLGAGWGEEAWGTESEIDDLRQRGIFRERNDAFSNFGSSLAGCVLVLNTESFVTRQAEIVDHPISTSDVYYDIADLQANTGYFDNYYTSAKHSKWFIEGPNLDLLDAEGEWVVIGRDLYVWPRNGVNPNDVDFLGKVSEVALNLQGPKSLVIDGIDFFGTTFVITDARDVTVSNSELLYPTWSKRALGVGPSTNFPMTTLNAPVGNNGATSNKLSNIQLAFTDGSINFLGGAGNLVENFKFHHLDYSALGRDGMDVGSDSEVTRLTCHTVGTSTCLRPGHATAVSFVHGWNTGMNQWDGAIVHGQGTGRRDYTWQYMWGHDNFKKSFRFDGGYSVNVDGKMNRFLGSHGRIHRAVSWNTDQGITSKGQNMVTHTTGFDVWKQPALRVQPHFGIDYCVQPGDMKAQLKVLDYASAQHDCTEAFTVNNLADTISTAMHAGNRFPNSDVGYVSNNKILDANNDAMVSVNEMDMSDVLRDPKNLDFRPKASSTLVVSKAQKGNTFPSGTTSPEKKEWSQTALDATYSQSASGGNGRRDIGAYQHDSSIYWIPGFQASTPSTPVPPNRATGAKLDLDLMFLPAWKAVRHEVYFGFNKDSVVNAKPCSPEFLGEFLGEENIATPGGLDYGVKAYWRVRAFFADNSFTDSPVWEFETEEDPLAAATSPTTLSFNAIEDARVQTLGKPSKVFKWNANKDYVEIGTVRDIQLWVKFNVPSLGSAIVSSKLEIRKSAYFLPIGERNQLTWDDPPTDNLKLTRVKPATWDSNTLSRSVAETTYNKHTDVSTVNGVGAFGTASFNDVLEAGFQKGKVSFKLSTTSPSLRKYARDASLESPRLTIERAVPAMPTITFSDLTGNLDLDVPSVSGLVNPQTEVYYQKWDEYMTTVEQPWTLHSTGTSTSRPFMPSPDSVYFVRTRTVAGPTDECANLGPECIVGRFSDTIRIGDVKQATC